MASSYASGIPVVILSIEDPATLQKAMFRLKEELFVDESSSQRAVLNAHDLSEEYAEDCRRIVALDSLLGMKATKYLNLNNRYSRFSRFSFLF
jgi:hypothetical protein